MSALKYWLWLSARKGLKPEQAFRLLECFGTPEGAYFADPGEYDLVPGLPRAAREALTNKNLEGSEAVLEDCQRLGLRILTFGDADYPERLKNIYDPPVVLYIRGRFPAFDEEAAVAVVGSRNPSAYGRRMAGRLGLDLARQGALVVSGIARGIDTEVLRGALKGGGRVVSVLGGGIDVIYPRENRALYEDVAAAGALISEYPPGTENEGWHFPVRNRIISGLSLGVAAVECTPGSGTMTTVKQALEQDRDIFAVPGNADSPLSEGPNRLIRMGARLVMGAWDILQEYEDRFSGKLQYPRPLGREEERARLETSKPAEESEGTEKAVDKTSRLEYIDVNGLTDDQIALISALEGRPLSADELIEATQIPAKRVLSGLTLLQVQGYASELPGRRFETLVRLKRK